MPTSDRSILVLAPLPHCFTDLCESVQRQPWVKSTHSEESCIWQGKGLTLRVERATSVEQAWGMLHSSYYNLVMVDCRNLPHEAADPERQEKVLLSFLEALRSERDQERRYPRRRVVVLVGDNEWVRVDRLLFEMGQRHVGACVRDRSLSPHIEADQRQPNRDRFIEHFFSLCQDVLLRQRKGRKAINLAAGGISGIYYQLGVLKCLDDATDLDLVDFDLYFGISGGAVLAGCMANGLPVDDLITKIGALDSEWRYRLRLGWRHVNIGEVPKRLALAQRELVKYLVRMVKREDDFSMASIFGTWAVLLGPLFDNSEFDVVLRRMFADEGRTNDFRELKRRLFVGATDQDSREHVLFGDHGFDHVPISRAIQASAAMHPFFPSVEIDGRFYTDGLITRTSNLTAAIQRGADLVFVVDPFVPLVSDEAGFNARHGNMWIIEQDIKTLSYTRFEQARNEIIRQNPQVNVYTFVPSNRMRRLMSGQNPFVSRNFHPIVCAAYRSTARRLKQLEYKICGELASHDIGLDLGPVEERVKRLRDAPKPDVRLLLEESEGNGRGSRVA